MQDQSTTLPPFDLPRHRRDVQRLNDLLAPYAHKWCGHCKNPQPWSAFGEQQSSHDGLTSQCRKCRGAYQKQRQPENRHYKGRYGITPEAYEALYQKQEGRCAICDKKPRSRLYVDHDHKTGKVRGLLCPQCNTGLGQFHDDMGKIRKAIAYLQHHEELARAHEQMLAAMAVRAKSLQAAFEAVPGDSSYDEWIDARLAWWNAKADYEEACGQGRVKAL